MKGTYILIIKFEEEKTIEIGKLGKINFKDGFYVYVGSALNGLEQRIDRHLRKTKKKHWHIDYFLDFSCITDIFFLEDDDKKECKIVKKLEKHLFSINGFGSSDCRCKSHLFFGSQEEITNLIKTLQMNQYNFKK